MNPFRSELRATVALAMPMMLGQGAQMAMHLLDTAMVGRLGVDALAASAMGNNAAALLFFSGIAIGTTVPVLAARAFGAGDRARLNLVLRHGLTLSLLYGTTCAAIFAVICPRMLTWFGAPHLVAMARPYATLLMFSLIPALLTQNLRGFSEAQNRPWLPFGNIVLGVGLNAALNYGLIYGHFGLPALGLTGAALGTLLARLAMLLHYIAVLRGKPELRPTAGAWRPVRWRHGFYGEYLRIAIPSAAMILVWIGNNVVIATLMGRLGPTLLAAHEIVRQTGSLLFTFSTAFQSAVAIRVALAAGRGDSAGVRRVAWSSVLALGGIMLGVAGLLVLGREQVALAFVGASESGRTLVVPVAVSLLAIAGWNVALEAGILAGIGVFRGLAQVRIPAAVYFFSAWALGVPLAYWLGIVRGGGGTGIWSGIVAANFLTVAVLIGLLHRALKNPANR